MDDALRRLSDELTAIDQRVDELARRTRLLRQLIDSMDLQHPLFP